MKQKKNKTDKQSVSASHRIHLKARTVESISLSAIHPDSKKTADGFVDSRFIRSTVKDAVPGIVNFVAHQVADDVHQDFRLARSCKTMDGIDGISLDPSKRQRSDEG